MPRYVIAGAVLLLVLLVGAVLLVIGSNAGNDGDQNAPFIGVRPSGPEQAPGARLPAP